MLQELTCILSVLKKKTTTQLYITKNTHAYTFSQLFSDAEKEVLKSIFKNY